VLTSPVFHRIESVHEDLIGTAMARCRHLFRRFRRFAMIQVYVPVLERRRITIPLVAYKEMGVEPGGWLRLSVVEHADLVRRPVPAGVHVAESSDRREEVVEAAGDVAVVGAEGREIEKTSASASGTCAHVCGRAFSMSFTKASSGPWGILLRPIPSYSSLAPRRAAVRWSESWGAWRVAATGKTLREWQEAQMVEAGIEYAPEEQPA
jgi:hypothetical protein